MATTNYEEYLVKTPARESALVGAVRNRTFPALTYMSSSLVPEANYHIDFGWVWGLPGPDTCLPETVSE
jgi:hypothetical protein